MKRTNNLLLISVAQRFKEIRLKRELTQEKVTFDTGINIGLIEVGKTNISIVTLITLCNYYNISLEDFVKGIEYDKE